MKAVFTSKFKKEYNDIFIKKYIQTRYFNFNEDILINGLKIYETLLKYKKSIG